MITKRFAIPHSSRSLLRISTAATSRCGLLEISSSNTPLMQSSPREFTSRRHFSFTVFYDESDPDITLAHAREIKRRLEAEGSTSSSKYLNALISVAIGHFQKKDYVQARKCAVYAHDTITDAKGTTHTLRYFAAVTVSRCSRALAAELQAIVDERKEASNLPSGVVEMFDDTTTLLAMVNNGAVGKRFKSLDQLIAFLRSEADMLEKSADRLLSLPDKYFMRTEAQHREEAAKETSQSSHDYDDSNNASASDYFKNNSRNYSYDTEQRRKRAQENYDVQSQFSQERAKYKVKNTPSQYGWQCKRAEKKTSKGWIRGLMKNPK